ncbi:MAG TPA: cytochrome c oxidase subunit II [Burkholderiaceae bacterium]|jgi:cytochrome c oxidase subunit 2|nr:cytochrome c oxidase subunit II [Burkholderiaceae bacterium]HPE02575.1 cytochrome c oxidase subunit II [Burkholderiaceae bacterium]HRZ01911.1 cytochrome c oxidase subunit II [Burkholderiaceae bacterium]
MKLKLAILKSAALAAGLGLAGAAAAALPIQSKFNLAPPVTQIAEEIYSLHTLMLVICGVIFVAVFGVMFYSIWKHRASKGAVAETWHENTKVEIIWTVIPFLIVIGMAIPATKTVVAMKDTSNADLTIKVTGYQWKWGYDYLRGEGEGISFVSSLATPISQIMGRDPKNANYLLEVTEPLVVPVDKKVRIITTAADVIHAWWVPAFGVKQDAIPGFARDTWFRAEKVGTYRGECAELCGKDHAFMPVVVVVKSAEDYAAWVADRKKAMAAAAEDPSKVYELVALKTMGAKVYEANCQVCHQANGKGVPNAFPALDGSKVVNGPQADVIALLLNGKGAMPAWKGNLSATQIASVITYVENSWGNATGKAIQPAEVLAAKK